MSAADTVRSTAIARREVRNSLRRLEYHLSRGAKGALGVNREVAFLDALHRQVVRVNGGALGVNYTGRGLTSFGQKALAALSSGNASTIGRARSSLLADFSANGLQPARDLGQSLPDGWVWTANASACPTCLLQHGAESAPNEFFTPLHPSCLCIPMPKGSGIRRLSDDEVFSTWSKYGDDRYARSMAQWRNGQITREQLARVEAVNRTPSGAAAVRNHLLKGEARVTGLPAPTTPSAAVTSSADDTLAAISEEVRATTAQGGRLNLSSALEQDGVTYKGTAKSLKTLDEAAGAMEDAIRAAGLVGDDANAVVRAYQRAIDSVKHWRANVTSSENYTKNGYWWKEGRKKLSPKEAEALRKAGRGDEILYGRTRKVERELYMEMRRNDYARIEEWKRARRAAYDDAENKFLRDGLIDRDEYNRLLRTWDEANPRPKPLYDANADEIAQTFIHELTHVLDVDETIARALSGTAYNPNSRSLSALAQEQGIIQRVQAIYAKGNGDTSFWYAATPGKPRETIAELTRMFFFGDRGGVSYASTNTLGRTAAQWRNEYPDLASFVLNYIVRGMVMS